MMTIEGIRQKAAADKVSVSLLFKEQVQLIILDYLFRKGLFSQMVFQGGTALRLAYQGVRYSEDLDFVLQKKNAPCFKDMHVLLQPITGHIQKFIPFIKQAQLKAQKESSSFKRYCLILETDFLPAKDKTNIEIANVPSRRPQTIIIRHADMVLSPAVTVERPEEILSDKLLAFSARDYIKGRDLWDIYFLLNTMKMTLGPDIVTLLKKKILDYDMTPKEFLNSLKKRVEALSTNGTSILREEMDRFLPGHYREAFKSQYADICREQCLILNQLLEEMKK